MQQIIVSGVGGQGVLFITKLLAETALELGYSVLISETHGMAQRGGNVISHLKVSRRADAGSNPQETDAIALEGEAQEAGAVGSGFKSPLIRPGHADILLALHPEAFAAHGFYLKPGGHVFRNSPDIGEAGDIDALAIASKLGSPVSANLVLLGFAVASQRLFCSPEALETVLKRQGGKRAETALKAFQAGLACVPPHGVAAKHSH